MITSTTSNYENNWHKMTIKSEPNDCSPQFQTHESDSPIQTFDTKAMFFETNIPNNYSHPLGFNPLTPPGYPNILLSHQRQALENQRPSTPCSSYTNSTIPAPSLTPTHTPPMDVTPPKSPKENNETPEKDTNTRSECADSYDEPIFSGSDSEIDDGDIKSPAVNSHGKIRTHKCKQCNFVAVTKAIFWEHSRGHIKPEKVLSCPKCPFVTEYKHHLEYHLRNHQRSKPFQCPNCSYTCVNKSMLNSHLKSHSAVFQYRCADCNYASKYCHSLKIHLRKYAHNPDVVLNPDGTPNPLPIIDVYGTRRGPKTKANQTKADVELKQAAKKQKVEIIDRQSPLHFQAGSSGSSGGCNSQNMPTNISPLMLPNALANMFNKSNSTMPLLPYFNLNQMLRAIQQPSSFQHSAGINIDTDTQIALNLIQDKTPIKNDDYQESPRESTKTPMQHVITPSSSRKDRRKGRAYKLQTEKPDVLMSDDSHELTPRSTPNFIDSPQMQANTSTQNNNKIQINTSNNNNNCSNNNTTSNSNNKDNNSGHIISGNITNTSIEIPKEPTKVLECKHCYISFKDDVLYTVHMGYHGYDDVFKCNMCGEKCDDRVSFFLHIARNSHT